MTIRDSLIAISILLTLGGCAEKTAKTEQPAAPAASAPAAEQPAAQPAPPAASTAGPPPRSVAGPAAPTSGPVGSTPRSVDEFVDEPALHDVFFEPGRADIGRNGTRVMRDNVRWIVENPGHLLLVEGHSDYKGSADANLAMSERRARAAVSFLLKEGVAETRLWTISYGSAHPVCAEKTDACAAKNRRVHFRVKKP
jgi:outer membrane protein OmpA-like peptidoglycan-associated protein